MITDESLQIPEEAAPCPFCRSSDMILIEGELDTGYFISCLTCNAQGPCRENPLLAYEAWQRRCHQGESLALESYYLREKN